MSTQILSPFPYFTARNGAALNEGYVYIGEPNADPEIDPVACYYDPELTIPASQPLRTEYGYVVSAPGTPATLYIAADQYSIRVRMKNLVQVFYRAVVTDLGTELAGPDGSNLVGFLQAGTGAVARPVQDVLRQNCVSIMDFGATGTDGNDRDAFLYAIEHCQSRGCGLYFPPSGIYTFSETIDLGGEAVSFYTDPLAPMRRGGAVHSATIRWRGSNDPMFRLLSNGWSFSGFSADNCGSSTEFMEITDAQELYCSRMSFITNAPEPVRFSRAIFATTNNALGYSRWENIRCLAASENFILLDGNNSSNGSTPMSINDSLFESNGDGSMTVFYLREGNVEGLTFNGNTLNQQVNALRLLDTREIRTINPGDPWVPAIQRLTVVDNEFDVPSAVASDRLAYLTDVLNIRWVGNTHDGAGVELNAVEVSNTGSGTDPWSIIVDDTGNEVIQLAGPYWKLGSRCSRWGGVNTYDTSNTAGVVNNDAPDQGAVPLTYGATVTLMPQVLPMSGGRMTITATDTNPFSVTVDPELLVKGQSFRLTFANASGGAISATPAGVTWKLQGAALPAPANGTNTTLTVEWTGAHLQEVGGRSGAVPN